MYIILILWGEIHSISLKNCGEKKSGPIARAAWFG